MIPKLLITKLAAAIMLALAVLTPPAKAQTQQYPLLGTPTLQIAAGLSNLALNATFSVPSSTEFAITVKSKLTGAGTSGVLFLIDRSADNVTWETGKHAIFLISAGTAEKANFTNFTAGAFPYYRIGGIHNTNGTIATNISAIVTTKRGL